MKITITVTPQVGEAIDALLATGLFGFSRADVARRLVDKGVRDNEAFVAASQAAAGLAAIGRGSRKVRRRRR